MQTCSLNTTKLGDWLVKVSLSDAAFMLFGYNEIDMKTAFKVFQTEEDLVNYMENLND